ncbi:Cysteine desulfurase [hydrothermal vent metagenome]|uniref:Cysteine desulfurase n=1 Tax=hydrothermal vent metagenome TaxID=652676 RepID=A0A3B0SIW9_9ZZZZ
MSEKIQTQATELIEQIRQSVIGEGDLFPTPFGLRPLIYSDYTASGRAVRFIEDYITDNVLPFYANTHSEASATGRQTTAFREQARGLIRKSLNAGDDHAVIFCGSGASSAIQKLVDILNIRIPANLDDVHGFSGQIDDGARPVVFVGPYEHHSNELAWRETIVDMVAIPLGTSGGIDQDILRQRLAEYADRPLKIASFSAASNVTGLLTDVEPITRLLHEYGALAFWDYAAAGPYVAIDMTGIQDRHGDSSIDALYISPHKFIGGPGTPGVLVLKRKLLTNRVPSLPGGGTVSYVSPEGHKYYPAGEAREEGGTPAIVESIRAGLVFQLKDAVGANVIERLEDDMIRRAIKRWSQHPAIHILGDLSAPRTSILSFLVMWQGKPLHFGFVDALMSDLFGIQVRGGCSCAGPYGHELLDIDMDHSRAISRAVDGGHAILKPGWVRLNFNYFIGEETFDYVLQAVELIAEHGWRLLGKYHYDPDRGIWINGDGQAISSRNLDEISFDQGIFQAPETPDHGPRRPLPRYLEQARQILTTAEIDRTETFPPLPAEFEDLRWFAIPADDAPQKKSEGNRLIRTVRKWLASGARSTG